MKYLVFSISTVCIMLNKLSDETARLIGSTQVIVNVSSVVKELVENSIDAVSSTIEVKLEDYGFCKIQVRDNGSGIKVADMQYAAQRHFTSKITSDADLQTLTTYGFRGEGLSSLCEVADVSICTRTKNEVHSTLYILDSHGYIKSSKPCHAPVGTTVYVCDLFKQFPVRRQYFSSSKKKREQLKSTEDIIMAIALAHPTIQISLYNDKVMIWQKPRTSSNRAALTTVLSSSTACSMEEHHAISEDAAINITAFITKPLLFRKTCDRCFVIVNKRPVRIPKIDKALRSLCSESVDHVSPGWPVCLIAVEVPPNVVDPNVNASKTEVFVSVIDEVIPLLENMFKPFNESPTAHSPAPNLNLEISSHVKDKFDGALACGGSPMEAELHGSCFSSAPHEADVKKSCMQIIDKKRHVNEPTSQADKSSSQQVYKELSSRSDTNIANFRDQASGQQDNNGPCSSNTHNSDDDGVSPSTLGASFIKNDKKNVNKNEMQLQLQEEACEFSETCPNNIMSNEEFPQKFQPPEIYECFLNKVNCSTNEEQMIPEYCVAEEQPDVAEWSRGETVKDCSVQPVKILSALQQNTLMDKKKINSALLHKTLDHLVTTTKKSHSNTSTNMIRKQSSNCKNSAYSGDLAESHKDVAESKKTENLECSVQHVKRSRKRNSFLVLHKWHEIENDEEKFEVHEENIDFDLGKLKNSFQKVNTFKKTSPVSTGDLCLVGNVKSLKSAVVHFESSLYLVNLLRLQECLIFNNLLSHYSLSCTDLDQWLELNEECVSRAGILVLKTLKQKETTHPDFEQEIMDERIVSNGFRIGVFQDQDNRKTLFGLFSMTLKVPYYCVSDLKDILLTIQKNPGINLKKSRPSKLLYYFQGEAARTSRGGPLYHNDFEVKRAVTMLCSECLPKTGVLTDTVCFHNKSVFHKLYSFSV